MSLSHVAGPYTRAGGTKIVYLYLILEKRAVFQTIKKPRDKKISRNEWHEKKNNRKTKINEQNFKIK